MKDQGFRNTLGSCQCFVLWKSADSVFSALILGSVPLTFIDWSAFVGLCWVVGAVLFALLLLSFCY